MEDSDLCLTRNDDEDADFEGRRSMCQPAILPICMPLIGDHP
jgi:hypothetical protein